MKQAARALFFPAAVIVLALANLTGPVRARAQTPPAPAAPAAADTLVSPELHPDRRVTFRLRAPKASQVSIAGEWTRPGARPSTPEALQKDAQGIWSLTVGPLAPNVYIYTYAVDGMTITDPVNPLVKLRARTSGSMVEVPGAPGEVPWEVREVPHGTLQIETHAAKSLGNAARQIVVYTPPGYERGSARYPVLYLLHGNNDLHLGWTMAGRANLILDNLIAAKQAVPMIVVMPWGHALPFGTRPPTGQPGNNDVFARYLVEDVMPLVEKKYRVTPGRKGREQRAVFGLSMGGAQALQVGLGHRDLFSAIGMFGAGMLRADFDARYQAPLAESPQKDRIGLFFIGIGKEDGGLAKSKELAEALRAAGQPVTYQEVEGGHTYPVWRLLLAQAAPLVFKKTKAPPP